MLVYQRYIKDMPPTNLLMAKGLAATGVQPLLLKARRPGQPQAELQFMVQNWLTEEYPKLDTHLLDDTFWETLIV